MSINAYTDNLFVQGFDRNKIESNLEDLTVENRESFYTAPISFNSAKQEGVFVASWLDKGLSQDEMYDAAEKLGVKLYSHNVFHEDFLAPVKTTFLFGLLMKRMLPVMRKGWAMI